MPKRVGFLYETLLDMRLLEDLRQAIAHKEKEEKA